MIASRPSFSPHLNDQIRRWRNRPAGTKLIDFSRRVFKPLPRVSELEREMAANIVWLEENRRDFSHLIDEILGVQSNLRSHPHYERWVHCQALYLRQVRRICEHMNSLRSCNALLANDFCLLIEFLKEVTVFRVTETILYACLHEGLSPPYAESLEVLEGSLREEAKRLPV